MTIRIIREPITLDELRSLAQGQFGDFVKAVVEFDSMVNIRPSLGNRSRSVEDAALRQQIATLVTGLIGP